MKTNDTKRPFMNTLNKLTIAAIAMLFIWSCGQNNNNDFEEIAIPVSVEEIQTSEIEQFIETSGTLYSTREVYLKSEMAGKYHLQTNPKTRKPYQLGDPVNKGDVIIKLEDKEFENGITVESKKLNLDITKRMYEQQQSLYKKGGITLKELTDAERSYIDARYSYENAVINLEKLNVTAPFSGIIVDLPFQSPDVKINASTPLVKIMGYKEMFFEINLPEKEMGQVKTNQSVRIFNYSYPKDTFPAKISQLSPVINPDTRSFKGYITVTNPDLKLRPGMFVKAEIITASKSNVIVIPMNQIISKNRRKIVYVVEKSEGENKSFTTANERSLKIGLSNPDEVEVIDGLEVGDRIVVRGFETLRNRSKVRIVR